MTSIPTSMVKNTGIINVRMPGVSLGSADERMVVANARALELTRMTIKSLEKQIAGLLEDNRALQTSLMTALVDRKKTELAHSALGKAILDQIRDVLRSATTLHTETLAHLEEVPLDESRIIARPSDESGIQSAISALSSTVQALRQDVTALMAKLHDKLALHAAARAEVSIERARSEGLEVRVASLELRVANAEERARLAERSIHSRDLAIYSLIRNLVAKAHSDGFWIKLTELYWGVTLPDSRDLNREMQDLGGTPHFLAAGQAFDAWVRANPGC